MSHLKAFPLILDSMGIHLLKVQLHQNSSELSVSNMNSSLMFVMSVGLVVSTCLAGAFVGSLFSGWVADGVGRRRAFQLCSLPMFIGASIW